MKKLSLNFAVAMSLLVGVQSAKAEMVITFGGDVNLNQSRAQASPKGTAKYGKNYTWTELFAGIAPLLNGNLNFANIETVVSDQKTLSEAPSPGNNERTYVFKAPPEGIAHGLQIGFNLLSLANNHTADYGTSGMMETIFHIYELAKSYRFWESGISASKNEAARPAVATVRTTEGEMKVAFLAMTAVHGSLERTNAREMGMGILSFYNESDFRAAMKALRETPAHYRILSVHWGREGKTQIEPRQREWAYRALKEGNVDLILGHHPHRVHPVEKVGDKVIFYSLGNYVMVGAANLNEKGPAEDYGLMGRLYLSLDSTTGKLVPQAVEAIPLTDVHAAAKPMPTGKANQRIDVLNGLSRAQLGGTALTFQKSRLGGQKCLGQAPGTKARQLCP
ncbi:MAG: CapA family protein [Bdellovibrionaceae bacterium]|nr:CapA family protein [Pseudobdellovibrionaceae bacterium]